MPKASVTKPARPKCRLCGQTIRVPKGWMVGPAARKHYWAKHREVMMPKKKGRRGGSK